MNKNDIDEREKKRKDYFDEQMRKNIDESVDAVITQGDLEYLLFAYKRFRKTYIKVHILLQIFLPLGYIRNTGLAGKMKKDQAYWYNRFTREVLRYFIVEQKKAFFGTKTTYKFRTEALTDEQIDNILQKR